MNAKLCAPIVDKQVFVTTPFYNLNGVVYYTFDLAIRAKYNGVKTTQRGIFTAQFGAEVRVWFQ